MYSEVLEKQALESLQKYFKHISQTGYMSYDTVDNILGYLFVDSLLNTGLSIFVDEKDYKDIDRFLYCLYGTSCLAPYPEFIRGNYQLGTIIPGTSGIRPFRMTEDDINRITEDNSYRTTEYRTKFWE